MKNELPYNVSEIVKNPDRLAALQALRGQGTAQDGPLDTITTLVTEDLNVPVAFVSLIDEHEQRFQSCIGTEMTASAVEDSFCAHAIADGDSTLVIRDAKKDPRFRSNPFVTGEPGICFYAGVPLVIGQHKIGTLCAVDTIPRKDIDEAMISRLETLASLASSHIALKSDSVEKRRFELQHSREIRRHRLSLKASNVVSWIWNVPTDSIECDQEMRDMFNITHDKPLKAAHLVELIHPEDVPRMQDEYNKLKDRGDDFETEFRISKSGNWVISQGAVLECNDEGEPVLVAGVNLDISDQKKSEEKTRLLLKELNHRVKNTLAILQSIAAQTLKSARSPEEFKKAFSGRIRGIASAHTLLSDREWEQVDIHQLVREQVRIYLRDEKRQLRITGDEASLGPEESLAFGLVIHELATNAAKYGAFLNENGMVDITTTLKQSDQGQNLTVHWVERNGPEVRKPEKSGFGSVMITRSLDKIIGSSVELHYPPDGVEALITIPISDV